MIALDDWGREIHPKPPAPVNSELQAMAKRIERLEAEVIKMRPRAVSPLAPRHGWVQRIAETIADQWEVPVAQVIGRSRVSVLMRPRFVLAWVVDQVGVFSLPQTAQMIGYQDHTSVIYARGRVNAWREVEPEFVWATDQLLTIARRMREESLASMRAMTRVAVHEAAGEVATSECSQ